MQDVLTKDKNGKKSCRVGCLHIYLYVLFISKIGDAIDMNAVKIRKIAE